MNKTRYLITAALSVGCAAAAYAQVGTVHVSGREIDAVGIRQNDVDVYDQLGNFSHTYSQIAGAFTDAWGYRDGAADRNSQVYFGWGGGVARHNADGSGGVLQFDGTNAPNGNYRALAFDPTGNGGAGSFWSANFGSGMVEVDMAGGLLNSFANGGAVPWSLYGLAYVGTAGGVTTLLGHTTAGNVLTIVEGVDTGTAWTFGPWSSAGSQGGLSGIRSGTFAGEVGAIYQGAPDEAAIYNVAASMGGVGVFASGPWAVDGATVNDHQGLGIASPVPEPASMIALALGAAALVARRRRKKAA